MRDRPSVQVLLQIDKDVRRLCPDISFFSQPTTAPNPKIAEDMYDRLHVRVQQTRLQSQSLQRVGIGMNKLSLSKRKAAENYSPLEDGNEAHWEVVERILFIYAKLNPGQGYVQGMNEIIGPIYYVFASDPREEWRAHAEADCFFCFTNLMSDIRDFFIKVRNPIHARLKKFFCDVQSLFWQRLGLEYAGMFHKLMRALQLSDAGQDRVGNHWNHGTLHGHSEGARLPNARQTPRAGPKAAVLRLPVAHAHAVAGVRPPGRPQDLGLAAVGRDEVRPADRGLRRHDHVGARKGHGAGVWGKHEAASGGTFFNLHPLAVAETFTNFRTTPTPMLE